MSRRQREDGGWASLLRRGSGLVDRLSVGVKEAGRGTLLQQALQARARGNVAAAFWLLLECHADQPEDADVCVAFWDVAVDHDRAELAAPAVAWLVERHANAGELELACQYWIEYVVQDPDAMAAAPALGRILRSLSRAESKPSAAAEVLASEGSGEEGSADEASGGEGQAHGDPESLRQRAFLRALAAMVDERNEGLTSTLAFRVAELAAEHDRESALAAARVCLASEGLHDAKRAWLADLVAGLTPGETLLGVAPAGQREAVADVVTEAIHACEDPGIDPADTSVVHGELVAEADRTAAPWVEAECLDEPG